LTSPAAIVKDREPTRSGTAGSPTAPGQAIAAQAPEKQTPAAGQTFPQEPQFVMSVARSTHRSPQRCWLAGQVGAQAPALQVVPGSQAWPHAPQCAESDARSAHVPPHRVPPAPVHVAAHVPAAQAQPAAQAFPQAPQFAGSLRVSTQRASTLLPQVASGAAQEGAHVPAEHTCSGPQAFPQAPQFAGSLRASTQ
jgi:hypothetical protein